MTKQERHRLILENLELRGRIHVAELANVLDVSAVTMRKDLSELEETGKLYRSHGYAVKVNPYTVNRSVIEKENLMPAQKKQIGIAATRLVSREDTLILASGTTIHAFARELAGIGGVTAVCASLQASEILSQNEGIEVIQLGGSLRHSSQSVVGEYAKYMFESCNCSKLFLGVDGIDVEYGITTTNLREAELNRVMIQAAQKVIVLADSTKFNKRGFSKIANLDEIDLVITDEGIAPQLARQLEERGLDLLIVDAKGNAVSPSE